MGDVTSADTAPPQCFDSGDRTANDRLVGGRIAGVTRAVADRGCARLNLSTEGHIVPICEIDPWRLQYFDGVDCPAGVFIPTEDSDAWTWNPPHRWVYDKLAVALSQNLSAAPHGVAPPEYPVFSKPIYNLKGMGVGSRALASADDYARHYQPGHFWTELLQGEHTGDDVRNHDEQVDEHAKAADGGDGAEHLERQSGSAQGQGGDGEGGGTCVDNQSKRTLASDVKFYTKIQRCTSRQ